MKTPRPKPVDLHAIVARIQRNLAILLGGTGVVMALNFMTSAINARALGASGVGTIALLQAAVGILGGLFSLGVQQPLIKLGRDASERGAADQVGAIALLSILVELLAALLAGSLALAGLAFGERLGLTPEAMTHAHHYAWVVFFTWGGAANGIFRLFDRFHYLTLVHIATALATLVVTLLLWQMRAPLGRYVQAYAAIAVVGALAQLLLALRVLAANHIHPRLAGLRALGRDTLREFFSYAWTSYLTSTINALRGHGDSLLLGAFYGPSAVGIYSVTKQLTGAMNKLAAAASSAIFPEVATMAFNRDHAAARGLVRKIAFAGWVIGLVALALALAIGHWLLVVAFGPAFGAGYYALVMMVVAVTIAVTNASFGGFVQAFASPVSLLRVYAASFLVFVVASPLCIYAFGIAGAAAGQAIFAMVIWMGCRSVLRVALADRSSA